jgi:hypothetical protein
MDTNNETQGRLRRTVDELIIAEMFLVQATIESVTALGDGLSALGRQLKSGDENGTAPVDSIGKTLRQIADDAREPYSVRFSYLRDLINTRG